MNCPYCNHNVTYTLATDQKKCALCKRKFSPKKIEKEILLIKYFCENYTANQAAKELGINYLTVKKRFELFRKLIANYLQDQYFPKDAVQYDEYVYLPKAKKKDKKNIFDAQNFLTFNYENKIYNILMPNLYKYKSHFLEDYPEDLYSNELYKFIRYNKIAKTQKMENIITDFWDYFEENIVKYKGIKNENFFYYLKEFEFKFNYSKEDALRILTRLYKSYNKK